MPFEMDRKLLIAAVILTLVLAFGAGMKYDDMLGDKPGEEKQNQGIVLESQPDQKAEAAEAARKDEPSAIKVYVAGAVDHPDVYELDKGARVYEALLKAQPQNGADLAAMGMARKLQDGETLYVCRPGETTPVTGAPLDIQKNAMADAVALNSLVNINQASQEELDSRLPGIGPALAGRIVDYRSNNGLFTDIEQLKEVSGIGNKKYQGIADLVTVD